MLFEKILGHPLIQADNTLGLLAVMCISVAIAIYLEQRYSWASKVSGAIIALIFAMVMANVGIIPISCDLYDNVVWGTVVPMSLALLLLQCDLNAIGKRTGKMLIVFVLGAAGTFIGALVAFFSLKGAYVATGGQVSDLAAVASMMTGSYIGGGSNFAALAAMHNLQGTDVTAAATVADNLLMAIYFFVLIACAGSRFFRGFLKHPHIDAVESGAAKSDEAKTQAAAFWARKEISLKDIAINIAYASTVVWVSQMIAGLFGGIGGNVVLDFIGTFLGSQYIWLTTISVIIATCCSKTVQKVAGTQEIGTFLVYLFLFVIGVPANIWTVITKSPLFLVLCLIMVILNMAFCFLGAKLCKGTLEDAILASNANIGGGTTAAGMAISQGWPTLVGSAILVGTLGNVLGNYLGLLLHFIVT